VRDIAEEIGLDFSRVAEILRGAAVAATLNGRPRKTLGWRTPAEILDQYLAATH
jgi:IS30 family transposase